jgi:hypothetical protein
MIREPSSASVATLMRRLAAFPAGVPHEAVTQEEHRRGPRRASNGSPGLEVF